MSAEDGEPVRIGPFDTTIDASFAAAYAAALRSDNPRYRDGTSVPPLAIAARIFPGQWAAMDTVVPPALSGPPRGGVHGSHDVRYRRPIEVGEPLFTYVERHSARPSRDHARVITRHITVDASDQPVVEQLWTTVLFGTTCAVIGPDAPDHAFPDDARARPVRSADVMVDAEMARMYADVSQDFSAHHFDLDAARDSGFDRLFLHGLCTMGLCAEAAVEGPAGGEPDRVGRVAVRFSSPAFLGESLRIAMFEAKPDVCAFEVSGAGGPGPKVITHGRVELGRPPPAV